MTHSPSILRLSPARRPVPSEGAFVRRPDEHQLRPAIAVLVVPLKPGRSERSYPARLGETRTHGPGASARIGGPAWPMTTRRSLPVHPDGRLRSDDAEEAGLGEPVWVERPAARYLRRDAVEVPG